MAWLLAMRGGNAAATKNSIQADLKRITSSCRGSDVEISAALLASVTQASHNEDDRREIMKHLRECLAEASGKSWQKVYAALMLLEALLKDGSPHLMKETAEGRHFDLVQRLSFLECFSIADKCVQGMVRTKAATLRKDVITALENVDLDLKDEKVPDDEVEVASTCSPESTESGTASAASSDAPIAGAVSTVGFGSEDAINQICKPDTSNKRIFLNNVVKVGHSDDTTSESECGGGSHSPPRSASPKRMSARERNERSTLGKEPSLEAAQAVAVTQPPLMDLLDF